MQEALSIKTKINVHAVWISDVHLGNKDCKADYLLGFLDSIETKKLYLLGDIIDLWSMSKNFHWPASHNQVLRKIMKMAKEGCEIFYIPGNHDYVFREYCGEAFGRIKVMETSEHITIGGKKLLMIHGDEFDDLVRFSGFIKTIGDVAYGFLLFLNRLNNHYRNLLGYNYWSLSTFIKTRVSNAAQAINIFEEAAIEKAIAHGYDGIVCGHIHLPNIINNCGVTYFNDGDWVENCSSLVERIDGKMELWHWSDRYHCLMQLNDQEIDGLSDEQSVRKAS